MSKPLPLPKPRYQAALATVALLIVAFWLNGLAAVSGKSATFDEPVHAFSSWLIVNHGDFRMNPEHPPLWKYVAGLGLIGVPLDVDLKSPESRAMLTRIEDEWNWTQDTLYRRPPPGATPMYGENLVWRARVANSVFMLVLGGVVAWWAWSWGGPAAAVIATAVLAVEPNFLAHGPLVTNDVATSAVIALAMFLTWRLGEKLTIGRFAAFAVTVGLALEIKFTCLLLAPMLGLPLLYRALVDRPWDTASMRSALARRLPRLGVAILLCTTAMVIGWACMWVLYRFREAPIPDGSRFDQTYAQYLTQYFGLYADAAARGLPGPTRQSAMSHLGIYKSGTVARALFWIADQKWVPQSWIFGLTYANAASMARSAFLLGSFSAIGFTWYFPLAALFKTPVTELGLLALSAVVGLHVTNARWRVKAARWKFVCLVVPPAVFMAIAMKSNLNIGMRHILPVYVPMIVSIGVALTHLRRHWRPAVFATPAILILLAVETLSVFPNYLAYFNFASGGSAGGLSLLGDSNLDWGQDLPALARWCKNRRTTNPTEPISIEYFGTVDWHVYGIDAIEVNESDPLRAGGDPRGGIYAVSATRLQGNVPIPLQPNMAALRKLAPLAVLNGTFYIYQLPPKSIPATPARTASTPATRPGPMP